MKEHFSLNITSLSSASSTKIIIISLILSIAIVLVISRKFNVSVFVSILILSAIIYMLLSSATGNNLAGSIHESAYPNPPHLGLDGVDLQNQYPYPQ